MKLEPMGDETWPGRLAPETRDPLTVVRAERDELREAGDRLAAALLAVRSRLLGSEDSEAALSRWSALSTPEEG